mgnify:CR=1 FL=1
MSDPTKYNKRTQGAIEEVIAALDEFEAESFKMANDEFNEWYAAQSNNRNYPLSDEE